MKNIAINKIGQNNNTNNSNKLDREEFKNALKEVFTSTKKGNIWTQDFNKVKNTQFKRKTLEEEWFKKNEFNRNSNFNKNQFNVNKNKYIENIKKMYKIIISLFNKIFHFIKKFPILTTTLVIIAWILLNMNIIHKTLILKNIDSLKVNIVEISKEKEENNIKYNKSIEELKKQIAKIEEEKNKYNTNVNITLEQKKALLETNINKLNLLSLK